MMKHIYYEIKKILNIKLVAIYVLIIAISMMSFYRELDNSMEEMYKKNIVHLIELYGYEKTESMETKLLDDYDKMMEIVAMEQTNMDKLFAGEMSAEEYTEYARLLAKIKSYEKPWEYVLNKHNMLQEKGGEIILSEYWECYFKSSFFHAGNILLFLLISTMIIAADKRKGLEHVNAVTYSGEKKIRIYKGITTGIIIGASVLLLQGLFLAIMAFTDRLGYIKASVNSLGIYTSDISMSIGSYLIIYIISMSLIYAASGGIIVAMFSRFGDIERR